MDVIVLTVVAAIISECSSWSLHDFIAAACTKTRSTKTKPSKRNETAKTNVTTKTPETKERYIDITYITRSRDIL